MKTSIKLVIAILTLQTYFATAQNNKKTTVVMQGGATIKTEVKFNNNIKIENKTTKTSNPKPTKEDKNNNTSTTASSIKAYSKYDFIAGEKVVAVEDFSQTNIGDFPLKWNTNGSAEVVNLDGQQGKWLQIEPKTTLLPEFIKNLPDNFTFEFDLACSQPFSLYSQEFSVGFVTMQKPSIDFAKWTNFKRGESGFIFGVHPLLASSKIEGVSNYKIIGGNKEIMKNKANQSQFNQFSKPMVHVAIWRQKDRIRVYLNEEKIWDLPKAFVDTKYNGIVFYSGFVKTVENKYYISNIRLAVGEPDTRNKLIDEGKFSTNGILFDVNSDKIKPSSFGILKEIAATLNENASVKIKIIGHTDSDGDDASNLALSKKRAEAVKNILNKEFGINLSRMETDGKGETQPAAPNTSAEGKANNRRVEFIKL